MSWEKLMEDPVLAGMILGALGVVGAGLRLMYNALVGAVVRVLDKIGANHKGGDKELIRKIREHTGQGRIDSLMTTIAPSFVIQRQLKRRTNIAPEPPVTFRGDED